MSLILDRLATALDPAHPEALLIGGQALPLYGVSRQTADIDCLAAADGATKLGKVLLAAGYKAIARSENVVRYEHSSPMLQGVDVLLVNPETFEKLRRDSQEWRTAQSVWRVPALPHLVALKLHAMKNNPKRREHDVGDIGALVRQNPTLVTREVLRELCAQFGPPDVWEDLETMDLWKS